MIDRIKHQPWLAYLIFIDTVMMVLVIFFNIMAMGPGTDIGMFKNSTREVNEAYTLDISLPPWTNLVISILVFVWNGFLILYALSTLWRRNFGLYVYVSISDVLTPSFYLFFLISMAMNIGWVFSWCYEVIPLAFVFNVVQEMLLCITLLIVHRRLSINLARMTQSQMTEVWFIRVFVNNGIAMWTQWVFILTLINLAHVVTYSGNGDQEIASTVSLCLFALDCIGWFIAENTVLDKYVRYTTTQYVVDIIAMAGIFSQNTNLNSRNSILSLVVLVMCSIMLLLHVLISIRRHILSERHQSEFQSLSKDAKIADKTLSTSDVEQLSHP
ncbi:uncharacterized protein LOC144452446 [Glandiceps talaboti]